MRSGIRLFLAAVLLSYGCSEDSAPPVDEDDEDEQSPDDDDDDDDDSTDDASSPSTARDSGPKKDSGPIARDSGSATGGRADSAVPSGTTSDAGSDDDDDDDDDVSTGGPEPVIPKPTMECPALKSGTNTIMGLSVEIVAGAPGSGKKGPLLFNWHGTGGTGTQALGMLPQQIKDEILAEGGMIVAPTTSTKMGTDVTFVLSVWYTPGDFVFSDLVVACAVEQYGIDPRRIYSTGCSAGGLMSGVMAYHRSSYLAASAPNSGGIAPIPGLDMIEDPAHVPAVMTMHGARGQGNDMVIVEFADTSQALDMGIAAAGGFVVNCDHGGGHCGAKPELLLASWQFMKDHPFGVSPEPYADGLPASFPDYCKIVK